MRLPGVAVALRWTPYVGDVLCVEVGGMRRAGDLTLTGSLCDVMHESVRDGRRSRSRELGGYLIDCPCHITPPMIFASSPHACVGNLFLSGLSLTMSQPAFGSSTVRFTTSPSWVRMT